MAAVSLQSTSTKSSWTSVFPSETISNPAQSLAFFTKFTAVGISTILYLRSNYPEEAFSVKNIDGLRVTLLRNNAHENVKKICINIKNAMKALKDGHLRELHVEFYPDKDSEEIIEKFIFKYDYERDLMAGSNVNPSGDGEALKKSTRSLLRSLATHLQTCEALPETAQMSMRLFYDDDTTPDGYNPPGFVPLTPNSMSVNFLNGESPFPIKMGKISSSWNRIQAIMQ